jgi:membrane-bound inhibitor of C-type lysozyme
MKSLCLASILLAATIAAVPAQPIVSATTGLTLTLGLEGDSEIRTIAYECEGIEPVSVEYINAAPNFLAIVPVNDETLVFTAVLAGSGARYAAGNWIWWTSGAEASLYDLTQGEDAEPIATCFEFTNTP